MMSRRMVSRDSAILAASPASPTASAARSSSLISSSSRLVALSGMVDCEPELYSGVAQDGYVGDAWCPPLQCQHA